MVMPSKTTAFSDDIVSDDTALTLPPNPQGDSGQVQPTSELTAIPKAEEFHSQIQTAHS